MTLPGGFDITEVIILVLAVLLVLLVSVLMGLLFAATSVRLNGAYFAMLTLAIADAFYILSKATDFVKWTGADEALHGVPVPSFPQPHPAPPDVYFCQLCLSGVYVSAGQAHYRITARQGFCGPARE